MFTKVFWVAWSVSRCLRRCSGLLGVFLDVWVWGLLRRCSRVAGVFLDVYEDVLVAGCF